jgi:hypothetical protein
MIGRAHRSTDGFILKMDPSGLTVTIRLGGAESGLPTVDEGPLADFASKCALYLVLRSISRPKSLRSG